MTNQFANPVYGGQDPFVCKGPDGLYYSVAESINSLGIDVYCSDKLTDRGIRRRVYTAEGSGPSSADLWAPELWYLRGKWYIYYSGAEGTGIDYWNTHRMYVLEADDPMGPYKKAVKLELGEYMSIDGTVMELPDERLIFFFVRRHEDRNTIFMAPMDSPIHICGEPVLLSKPEFPWESDINEGPFPIVRNGRIYLLYSANAAHLKEYCLALLCCNNPEDILNPLSWEKEKEPILTQSGEVIGTGHACIVPSPDESEHWLVFHSKFDKADTLPEGWNRVVNLLKVIWDKDERPVFTYIAQPGEAVAAPSGEAEPAVGGSLELKPVKSLKAFVEYGYYRMQTFFEEDGSIRIDGTCYADFGDKILIRGHVWDNFRVECTMESSCSRGEIGLLLRVNLPGAGQFLWQGYGVYFNTDGYIRFVKCDGKNIETLSHSKINADGRRTIWIEADYNLFTVYADEKRIMRIIDNTYPGRGQIGFGTLGGEGSFYDICIREI